MKVWYKMNNRYKFTKTILQFSAGESCKMVRSKHVIIPILL